MEKTQILNLIFYGWPGSYEKTSAQVTGDWKRSLHQSLVTEKKSAPVTGDWKRSLHQSLVTEKKSAPVTGDWKEVCTSHWWLKRSLYQSLVTEKKSAPVTGDWLGLQGVNLDLFFIFHSFFIW